MNERMAAGILAGLSVALIGSETILAAIRGFDPGLILFCLSIYAGAVGLLLAMKQLSGGNGSRIESVSERRARAQREGGIGGILEGYGIDDEFLGTRAARKPHIQHREIGDDELKAAVKSYAGMVGGYERLRETLGSIDEVAFRAIALRAGFSGVSRERALAMVMELVTAEAPGHAGSEEPELKISLDRETFDDYIRRSMTDSGNSIGEEGGDSFSINLDAAGLSGLPGEPPGEFSHKPDAVRAKRLSRFGGAS
jgi:hypothetical protein